MHFINLNFCISIAISLKLVPGGQMKNKSALIQVMAWHRTGDKPLPDPMLNEFTDAYMRHKRELNDPPWSKVTTTL